MTLSSPPPPNARHAPATLRNRDAILAVLRDVFESNSTILEIASGSGEHGVSFSQAGTGWKWHPTDYDVEAVQSIAAWRDHTPQSIAPPQQLDVCDPVWHTTSCKDAGFDGVFCANMIHIAPPEATLGLLRTTSAQLKTGGDFVLYGPFMVSGMHTAPSNAAFADSLQARDESWGIRDLGAVVELARQHRLVHCKTIAMPANNLCVHFKKCANAPHALP